ncbi:FHA domain-containing protein, partial [bacterium]|nr:FHA domain-containing protein [bacterium]
PPTAKVSRSAAGTPAAQKVPLVVDASTTVVLACDPFAPLTLELHKPVFVGRVPGNDFVLPNPQVSRRHCEVERVREGVAIRDLKSANGTYLNEARIERATVPFGGSFKIGPYTLEVRCVDALVAPNVQHFGDTMMVGPKMPDGLRGSFEDMPLHEILQGVEFNQKTGVIDIQGPQGVAGFVSFRGGAPHQARCGALEGEPAVLGLLALKGGRFVLRGDEAAVGPREIEASFTKVLLEHRRRSDENKK